MSFWARSVVVLVTAFAIFSFPGEVWSKEGSEPPNSKVELAPAKEPVRKYRTRDERRDTGMEHELTKWLSVIALAELEYVSEWFHPINSPESTRIDDFAQAVQLAVAVETFPWADLEVVVEYDSEFKNLVLDEATVAIEIGDFEIELGEFYFSFGENFSSFVSGPAIEFGETRDRGVSVSYFPSDRFDISAYFYDGDSQQFDDSDESLDWGFSIEASPTDFATFGVSYLSNLADSDEGFLADENGLFESRVDALSGFAVIGLGSFELTAEITRALSNFRELDSDRNKPRAWNAEFGYYPQRNLSVSLRLEGSSEFEGAPEFRSGVAVTYRVHNRMNLTVEFLRGAFERGLAEDSEERELDRVDSIGALLTVEF